MLLLPISNICAQDYLINKQLRDSSKNDLYLNFENTYFIKDNEFDNSYTIGFMGIGVFAKPTLDYYFTNNTRVSAGVFLLKYSGKDHFTQTIPIFSVQQRLTKNLDMIVGSIYSTNSHQIFEPIFRADKFYMNNVEYGLQFLYHSPKIVSDLWLNWEDYILKNDPFQEKLQLGSTSNFTLLSNKFGLHIPLQLLIHHQGGQINANSYPISTILNGATGLKMEYHFGLVSFRNFTYSLWINYRANSKFLGCW